MKILVISDSHGNIANLKHVMGFGKNISARAVVHCGDWNNTESIDAVLSFKIPLYTVLGNADVSPSVNEELRIKSEEFAETFLAFELDGKKIGIIHSFSDHVISNIESLNIVFFGHTHRQEEKIKDGIRFINPGALENGVSFAVYNTDSGKIEFINEQV